MERRKFLVGMGSLAAGSAAAMGTGAFTTVQANRQVDVSVADDSSALLALTTDPNGDGTDEATNADYVDTSGTAAAINVDSAASPDGGGTGVNANATTQINDLFRVVNQGTQAAVVYVDPDSISDSNFTFGGSGIQIDPQASNRPNGDYTNTSGLAAGVEDDQISLTGNGNGPTYSAYADTGTDDALEEFVLAPGESFDFGLYIKTDDTVGDSTSISESLEIIADATRVPDSY